MKASQDLGQNLVLDTSLDLRHRLTGGDRRSLGRSSEVLSLVRSRPERLGELVELLWDAEAVVRMRAADVLEKLSREPALALAAFQAELLGLMAETQQQELRWHLAAMVPRLKLSQVERERAIAILQIYLGDRSSIVKTFAMQGLWELSEEDSQMRAWIVDAIRELTRTGTAAMRARGRKLLGDAC